MDVIDTSHRAVSESREKLNPKHGYDEEQVEMADRVAEHSNII